MCWRINEGRLKTLLYVSCVIMLVIGAILLWFGFIISSSELIISLKYSYAGTAILSCGLIIIALGFIGFMGVYKEISKLTWIFILSSLAIGLLLIIFSSLLFYARKISAEVLMSKEECLKNFENADNLGVLAGDIMCSVYCPCTISSVQRSQNNLYFEGSASNALECNPCENIQIYEDFIQQSIVSWIDSELGYSVDVTSCAITSSQFNDAYFPSESMDFSPFMEWLEEKFKCSGLCNEQELLLFTDVNTQKENNACYKQLKDWASESLIIYGTISLIFGLFLIIFSSVAFSIVCCTKKPTQTAEESVSTTKEKNKKITIVNPV